MVHLSYLLMWFEVISGVKNNLEKNELILVGMVDNVEEVFNELRCKVGQLLYTYLGFHWVLLLNQWQFRMGWKNGFALGY